MFLFIIHCVLCLQSSYLECVLAKSKCQFDIMRKVAHIIYTKCCMCEFVFSNSSNWFRRVLIHLVECFLQFSLRWIILQVDLQIIDFHRVSSFFFAISALWISFCWFLFLFAIFEMIKANKFLCNLFLFLCVLELFVHLFGGFRQLFKICFKFTANDWYSEVSEVSDVN